MWKSQPKNVGQTSKQVASKETGSPPPLQLAHMLLAVTAWRLGTLQRLAQATDQKHGSESHATSSFQHHYHYRHCDRECP